MVEIMMIFFLLVMAAFCIAAYQVIRDVAEDLRSPIDHGRKLSSSLDRFYEEISGK